MSPTSASRRAVRSTVLVGTLALAPLVVACSSSDDTATTTTTVAPPAGTGATPGTTALTDEERLAEAKTVAVGFFEAQAVNDYDRARERSTGAAALTIDWAEAVNSITAAEDSGYQVPSVTSPNVRVQIDALTPGPEGTWTGTGFVELSFRPGPVASTTTTTAATPASTEPASPSTYVVDLTFEGEGDSMHLVDYRLDDLPYPVSQLFVSYETTTSTAGAVSGTTVLGHRDLDGSVQFLVELEAGDATVAGPQRAAFTPAPEGSPPGTALVPVGPDSIVATTFADPIEPGASAPVLAVLPGAFPGTAGTLTLDVAGGDPTTTIAGASATTLSWALPAWPELTPRPVGTVEVPTPSTSTSTTSTSSTSTTATTVPSSTTTGAPSSTTSTTRPPTSTTTSSSTTTTTEP